MNNWEDFIKALGEYRNKFYIGDKKEEKYYIEIYEEIYDLNILDKAKHADSILLFLNRWKCHIYPKELFSKMLSDWIHDKEPQIDNLKPFNVENLSLVNNLETIDILYESLMDFKNNGIVTMGDASTSKILHLILPKLFVMWDKKIKPYKGYLYSDFLIKMNSYAKSVKDDFSKKFPDKNIEEVLREKLEYPITKTFAKYIDEFNWYKAWGFSQ